MKYYLIVGEASGDLHASCLMRSLKKFDSNAQFRFFGGDLMTAEGGTCVKHYKELAYMGFVPVLLHLPTIYRNMAFCKQDIVAWHPDVVILVDYPGFNLRIAKFLRAKTAIPVYYYISPKIWAWKEWRVKRIKRDVHEMFSILPFEVSFYEDKHKFPIHYVGNPTVQEVDEFLTHYRESHQEFCTRHGLDGSRPIIALLAGSRRQEIKDNLPAMVEAASRFDDYQLVLAGAPSIDRKYYTRFMPDGIVKLVEGQTYELLSHATAALVTSGTATLETALLNVPQVVVYETPVPHLIRWAFKHLIKVKFISLVNLIVNSEVVPEMLADRFTVDGITNELRKILPETEGRVRMLEGYRQLRQLLGTSVAPDCAAELMVGLLSMKYTDISHKSSESTAVETHPTPLDV